MLPFAIVGSNELYEEGEHIVRARLYPWGMVKVEDPEISDFLLSLVLCYLDPICKNFVTLPMKFSMRNTELRNSKHPSMGIIITVSSAISGPLLRYLLLSYTRRDLESGRPTKQMSTFIAASSHLD